MDESAFHTVADETLQAIEDSLEDADQAGKLEVEAVPGVVTITLNDGKQFIVSKHTAMQQIWLSSPVSGGHHFNYDGDSKQWQLADGTTLTDMLSRELPDN